MPVNFNPGLPNSLELKYLHVEDDSVNALSFWVGRLYHESWVWANSGNPVTAQNCYVYDSSGTLRMQFSPTGNSFFNGGYLGIGTDDPQSQLHIVDTTTVGALARIEETGFYGFAGIAFYNRNGLAGVFRQNAPMTVDYGGSESMNFVQVRDANMTFSTHNAVRMMILNTGYVGIGTLTPASKFTCNGDIEVMGSSNGTILASPDGSRWRVQVDNTGALITTKL